MYGTPDPGGESLVAGDYCAKDGIFSRQGGVGWRREMAGDALEFCVGQRRRSVFQERPFRLDLTGEFFNPQRIDQDLDACLVQVVAAAMTIVHAQQGIEVGEQMLARQEGEFRVEGRPLA